MRVVRASALPVVVDERQCARVRTLKVGPIFAVLYGIESESELNCQIVKKTQCDWQRHIAVTLSSFRRALGYLRRT